MASERAIVVEITKESESVIADDFLPSATNSNVVNAMRDCNTSKINLSDKIQLHKSLDSRSTKCKDFDEEFGDNFVRNSEFLSETRERLGKDAIKSLASGLNKAAIAIQEFSQNEYDEQMLKKLNDAQLFRLLEEAYHSKKLDEKNKSAIFKEILEDVHESLSAVDKAATKLSETTAQLSKRSNFFVAARKWEGKDTDSMEEDKLSTFPKDYSGMSTIHQTLSESNSSMNKRMIMKRSCLEDRHDVGSEYDSENSLKTEVDEVETENASDTEVAATAANSRSTTSKQASDKRSKKVDENGNPLLSAIGGSNGGEPVNKCNDGSGLGIASRQLRPLSIYRHNPAFHSQRVSVSQVEPNSSYVPSTIASAVTSQTSSLTPLRPSLTAASASRLSHHPYTVQAQPIREDIEQSNKDITPINSKMSRQKKKAVKTKSVKAEDIDGYRGCDDLESILEYIEPKNGEIGVRKLTREKSNSHNDGIKAGRSATSSERNNKHRPKRMYKKSQPKRPQTPAGSALSSSSTCFKASEISPEETSTPSMTASRSSSPCDTSQLSPSELAAAENGFEDDTNTDAPFITVVKMKQKTSTNTNRLATPKCNADNVSDASIKTDLKKKKKKSPSKPDTLPQPPSNAKRGTPSRNKAAKENSNRVIDNNFHNDRYLKLSSGLVNDDNHLTPDATIVTKESLVKDPQQNEALEMTESCKIVDEEHVTAVDAPSELIVDSEASNRVVVETINTSKEEMSLVGCKDSNQVADSIVPGDEDRDSNESWHTLQRRRRHYHHESPSYYDAHNCQDVHFNYASVLKFIKNEWEIVTAELSNSSNSAQSKVVFYKA